MRCETRYVSPLRNVPPHQMHLERSGNSVLDSDIGRDIGRALNNLGLVRYLQGDLPGAHDYLERALHTNETAFGPDHPEVASTLNNLGQVLHRERDLLGARRLHERALAIKEAAPDFGPDSPSVAETLNYLGVVLHDLGELRDDRGELRASRDAHQRALDIFQALFPPDHPNVRTSREHLTAVQQALDEQADGTAEPPGNTPPRD
jgi:tetratricopeptide (TPR) repeat protein